MRNKQGFTLIELMIVVAIIAIIAAIAIPNLMRSKLQSNESAAIGNLRTICGAEVAYHAANNAYAIDFASLTGATPPFLDGDWSGAKSGYTFDMTGSTVDDFMCAANPTTMDKTGSKGFFVDSSGTIRAAIGAVADATSPAISD